MMYSLSQRIPPDTINSLDGASASLKRVLDFQCKMLHTFEIPHTQDTISCLAGLNQNALTAELLSDPQLSTKCFDAEYIAALSPEELGYLIWSFNMAKIPWTPKFALYVADSVGRKDLTSLDRKLLIHITICSGHVIGPLLFSIRAQDAKKRIRAVFARICQALLKRDLTKIFSPPLALKIGKYFVSANLVDQEFFSGLSNVFKTQNLCDLSGEDLFSCIKIFICLPKSTDEQLCETLCGALLLKDNSFLTNDDLQSVLDTGILGRLLGTSYLRGTFLPSLRRSMGK